MKRLLALLLALVMVVGLVACGAKEETAAPVATEAATEPTQPAPTQPAEEAVDESKVITDAKAELRVMLSTESPHLATLAEEWYPKYKEYFPNFEVEFDILSSGYGDKLKIACASGDMPDIFFNVGTIAFDTGTALPLDDLIEKYNWRDNLKGGGSLMPYSDGHVYTMQDGRDSYYLPQVWYNKDIFEAAGCEVPTTYDEFVEVCKKLLDYGVLPITTYNTHVQECFLQMLVETHSKDGYNRMISGELNWSDPEILKGVEKLEELVNIGAFAEDQTTINYDAMVELFNSGKAAMRIEPTWCFGGITLENFDFFVLPTETGEKVHMAYGSATSGNSIGIDTECPDEAFQFLCWMNLQSAIYFEQTGTFVDVITGYDPPEAHELVVKSNAIVDDTSWYKDPYGAGVMPAAEYSALGEQVGKLMTKQITAADFVTAMDAVE